MSARDERLRIALLDSITDWGGGQHWDVQTARALTERGHFVAIGCVHGSALEARARDAQLPIWSAALGPVGWRFGSGFALARFLRRARIECVIANVGRDVRLGALASWLAGAVLLQRRGLLRPLGRGRFESWLYTRHVKRVIVNSRALCNVIDESAPFLRGRVVLIPNAIEAAAASASDGSGLRKELGIEESAPLVGAAGRLAPMKGFEHLIAAWPHVLAARPSARLVVFGSGASERALRDRVERLAVQGSVVLAGFRNDVAALYDALDVFVLPSVRDESMSHAALAAMAHAKAVVLSDRAGGAELPLGTCRVVPSADARALAAAIVELLDDRSLREQTGRAARDYVLREHSLEAALGQLERVVSEAAREQA